MWSLQALCADHAVSLLTAGPVALDALNAFYGTGLASGDFAVDRAPLPGLLRSGRTAAALRGAFYQRHCRKRAHAYDVLISAYNACDFGVPAIQCLADFSWDEATRRELHPVPEAAVHRRRRLRAAYLALARRVAKPSGLDPWAPPNLVLANSAWSADLLRRRHGVEARVLYPPVTDAWPEVPPEARAAGFVCLGRVAPEKRIERVVAILGRVRELGHDVHLHVVGGLDDSAYGRGIRALCEPRRAWIHLEGRRAGAEKARLLTHHRFGLHACQGEAFGISVAEMVKAGCIPFVPAVGGQAEIVDHPELTYASEEEAVRKIVAVLDSNPLESALRAHLAESARRFSASRFADGLRDAVAAFVGARAGGRA